MELGHDDGGSETGGSDTLPAFDVAATTSQPDPSTDGNDSDGYDGGHGDWDIGMLPDAPSCQPGEGGSWLWVANTTSGTVSKINTATMAEEGRYWVRPDGSGFPSRIAVSLSNGAVVASRTGGITKFHSDVAACTEKNGTNGLQTSTGPLDVLEWDVEECRAWHTTMNYDSQRAVAWIPGTWQDYSCRYEDEAVWAAGASDGGAMVDVNVLDGQTGDVLEWTGVVGLDASNEFGIYGGATDQDGNFWGAQRGQNGRILRVNRQNLAYEIWDTPDSDDWYGMTYDQEGYLWLCASEVARFDVDLETWETANVGGTGGCVISPVTGSLWVAAGEGIVSVDLWNLQIQDSCSNTNGAFGMGTAPDGYLWTLPRALDQQPGVANRVDPDDCEVLSYEGLTDPYTYNSSMLTPGLDIMYGH